MSKQTYTIEINEYQRCLLYYVLSKGRQIDMTQLLVDPGDEAAETALGELDLILGMLTRLPETEPGTVHGFCW